MTLVGKCCKKFKKPAFNPGDPKREMILIGARGFIKGSQQKHPLQEGVWIQVGMMALTWMRQRRRFQALV